MRAGSAMAEIDETAPLSQAELAAIAQQHRADTVVRRLTQEIYRARRIAKDVMLRREADLSAVGESAQYDDTWNEMRELIGPLNGPARGGGAA